MGDPVKFPQPLDSDPEDVSWALSTGQAMWARGDRGEAIKWVKRASDSAADAGDDDRALDLARAAADLRAVPAAPPPPPQTAAPPPPPTPKTAPPPAPAQASQPAPPPQQAAAAATALPHSVPPGSGPFPGPRLPASFGAGGTVRPPPEANPVPPPSIPSPAPGPSPQPLGAAQPAVPAARPSPAASGPSFKPKSPLGGGSPVQTNAPITQASGATAARSPIAQMGARAFGPTTRPSTANQPAVTPAVSPPPAARASEPITSAPPVTPRSGKPSALDEEATSLDDWPTHALGGESEGSSTELDFLPPPASAQPVAAIAQPVAAPAPAAQPAPVAAPIAAPIAAAPAAAPAASPSASASTSPGGLQSIHVWVVPGLSGARIVPISSPRPERAVAAVLVLPEGATVDGLPTR